MARKHTILWALAVLMLAGIAAAADLEAPSLSRADLRLRSAAHQHDALAAAPFGKARGDTVYVIGGPDRQDGRFEDAAGNPDWMGWTSVDFTGSTADNAWHVDDVHVLSGVYSMVCGTEVPRPEGYDFGYGNDWRMALNAAFDVDPGETHVVRVTGTMRVDTEFGFDYVYLQVNRAGVWDDLTEEAVWDSIRTVSIDLQTTVEADELTGPQYDQIGLRFYFESDPGYSDEDGQYDSDGACWLDDLTVWVDGSPVHFEDFEDGVSDRWLGEAIPGCGNFGALYSGLVDLDPCRGNSSVQVTFVDNGIVVPGTGGTQCITWCYGPGGYIVNNTGGLLGPEYHVENALVSPPLQWTDGHDAALMELSMYVHEEMTPNSGGVLFLWWVRSTTSDDPAMLQFADWTTDYGVWYGPPVYVNHTADISSYLEPGRKWFQVRLEAWELGYIWDIDGHDGTPHPYIDNVRIKTYPFAGPAIAYDALYLAQDNFPEQPDIDFTDLGNNSIRFDMARNISPAAHLKNDPGDSLWIDVVPVRAGATLPQLPQMVVRMKANPVFDPYRTLPPGFTRDGDIITGTVPGDFTYNANTGALVVDRYNFDLPDEGFFYPGDVIHYFFEAWDDQAGDIGHTMLPGDTTGFASFTHDLTYPSDFICRGLPTLFTGEPGDQPRILLWNDFASYGGENEWYHALLGAGMREGIDYDLYYTNRPDAGEGNGLGGRATGAQLDGYDILLYTTGTLFAYTLGEGDYAQDPSRDLQVLDSWFARGGKKALFTGDDLTTDLMDGGPLARRLVTDYFGVQYVSNQVSSYIAHQTTPIVHRVGAGGPFAEVDQWIAYGGCLGINTFDAVEASATATRLAEFCDVHGNTGAYPYAAAVSNYNSTTDTRVIYLPYDFMFVYNDPDYVPPTGYEGVSARSVMLRGILNAFDVLPGAPIGVETPPAIANLGVTAYPNPFNPQTTLQLSMPRAGEVSVKIFDVQGRLVDTLFAGDLAAGRHELTWNGRGADGARQASGVYFVETRALGQTEVTRLAMIK
jgi:hypothetical protein